MAASPIAVGTKPGVKTGRMHQEKLDQHRQHGRFDGTGAEQERRYPNSRKDGRRGGIGQGG